MGMTGRAYWKGQIQISLVQFGVALYTGVESSSGVKFNQISRATGQRIKMQKTAGDEAVESTDIVKGFEYAKGQYVIIEPSELEELRVPSKHLIEVTQFVDPGSLPAQFIEKPYIVLPENDTQAEAYAIVRQALLKSGRMAIGKVAFSGREHILAIAASEDGGLMAYTLRFATEVRTAAEYFRTIKPVDVNADAVAMAETLIAKKTAPFQPEKFVDGYEVAVRELVDAKLKHLPIPKEAPAQPSNVVNIMDAFRKSLADSLAAEAEPEKKAVASEKKTRVRKTA